MVKHKINVSLARPKHIIVVSNKYVQIYLKCDIQICLAIDISILVHSARKTKKSKSPKDEDRAFNSVEYAWLKKNAPKFGFYHPSWAKDRSIGATPEAWHWEVKNPVVKVEEK